MRTIWEARAFICVCVCECLSVRVYRWANDERKQPHLATLQYEPRTLLGAQRGVVCYVLNSVRVFKVCVCVPFACSRSGVTVGRVYSSKHILLRVGVVCVLKGKKLLLFHLTKCWMSST